MALTIKWKDRNGQEHTERRETQNEAMQLYRTLMRNGDMAYGYISDDEALECANLVMEDVDEIVAEREREVALMLAGLQDPLTRGADLMEAIEREPDPTRDYVNELRALLGR